MKGKVFIGWSGSINIALKVKSALESDNGGYLCYIGGNDDNSSHNLTIGDTVISQMKDCNQAIMVFQNKKDTETVSNNMLFELGYLLAELGVQKIHCVRKENEKIILPSDFDNALVAPIEGDDDQTFVDGIVKYFFKRQRLTITKNKMELIDKRHIIRDYIESHYTCSKCSDYELAQYVLFYMQAAHMFDDEKKACAELLAFKHAHGTEFSAELALAVDLSIKYLMLVRKVRIDDDGGVYIDMPTLVEFEDDYESFTRRLNALHGENDDFSMWFRIFLYEQWAYAYMLYASNAENDELAKKEFHATCADYARLSLSQIEEFQAAVAARNSNDKSNDELISLLKAYQYRNLHIANQFNDIEGDEYEWLERSLVERQNLKNRYAGGVIDSKLYNKFLMEYYLVQTERLQYPVPAYKRDVYVSEIRKYLESVRAEDEAGKNVYIDKIEHSLNKMNQ